MARTGARFILRADIAQCYPSVYTHTVPWVLHTKPIAKAGKNDMTLFGNVLDRELQAANDGQTKGIAIGPDTSLGVAELLLTTIDLEMRKCGVVGGTRYIDDIELTFRRLADAEDALCELEAQCQAYELQLNTSKTGIHELPDDIDAPYASTLRSFVPPPGERARSAWSDFFNVAFAMARQYPADGVLRYALGCVQDVAVPASVWSVVQALIWQCVQADSGSMRQAINCLWKSTHQTSKLGLDRETAQAALDALIESSAPVGHGSELVWALWAALLFKVPLSTESAAAVGDVDDSFVALAASKARAEGVLPDGIDESLWTTWFTDDWTGSDHWLFVYEAHRRGWVPKQVTAANAKPNASASFLLDRGVTFMKDDPVHAFKPSRRGILAFGSARRSGA